MKSVIMQNMDQIPYSEPPRATIEEEFTTLLDLPPEVGLSLSRLYTPFHTYLRMYTMCRIPLLPKRPTHDTSFPPTPPPTDRLTKTSFPSLQLYTQVLARVINTGLHSPKDITSTALTCKHLRNIIKLTPFQLSLETTTSSSSDTIITDITNLQPPPHPYSSPSKLLLSLCSSYPFITHLDLSKRDSTDIKDADITHLMTHLPLLTALDISGFRKLTSASIDAIIGMNKNRNNKHRNGLRTLAVQRCFQLRSDSLNKLLLGYHDDDDDGLLSSLAMSHLDMASWTSKDGGTGATGAAAAATGIKVLALHNCTNVALLEIALRCPSLEALFLGGSAITINGDDATRTDDNNGNSVVEEEEEGDHPSAKDDDDDDDTDTTMIQLKKVRRYLHDQALLAQPHVIAPWLSHHHHHQCQYNSINKCTCDTAVELALLFYLIPTLSILEVTFCGPPILAPLVKHLVEGMTSAVNPLSFDDKDGRKRTSPIQIWDVCTPAGLQLAKQWSNKQNKNNKNTTTTIAGINVFEKAVARCSSVTRQTPLHVACEEGRVDNIRMLLNMGALVNARDKSGATPLFRACEAGHAEAAKLLLLSPSSVGERGGADLMLKNTAGEAPLYIAALKGHGACVDAILHHCRCKRLQWEDSHLYGDGWTPLMAAALGSNSDIVYTLLQAAAGPGNKGGDLVAAENRYGQNALHIAAMKGSKELIKVLMDAATINGDGSDSVEDTDDDRKAPHMIRRDPLVALDADGRTPADVARSYCNKEAWTILSSGGGRREVVEGEEDKMVWGRKGGHQERRRRRRGQAKMHVVVVVDAPGQEEEEEEERERVVMGGNDGNGRWVGKRLQQRKQQRQE